MERRQQPRIRSQSQTTINCERSGRLLRAQIRDFSQSGLFLQTNPADLRGEETLELIPDTPAYGRAPLPVKALVVRNAVDGVGLSFLEPCPRFLDSLARL